MLQLCSDAPEPPMITSEMDCSASNKLGCEALELEEGTEGAALDCSSSALPAADITWLKGGQEMARGGQFVFPDPLHRFEKEKQILSWKPDHCQEHLLSGIQQEIIPAAHPTFTERRRPQ